MVEKPVSGEDMINLRAEKGVPEEGTLPRAKWANKVEFFLCISSQIISIQALWSFPILLWYHGGAGFLIPYFFTFFFCGMPLLFLGLAVGQYTSQSGAMAWKKLCPMFQGIGIASLVLLTYMNISYVLVPVWSLFYLYNSFKSPMPWTTCSNIWNTALCARERNAVSNNNTDVNQHDEEWTNSTFMSNGLSSSSEMEFWRSIRDNIFDLESNNYSEWMQNWGLIPCLIIVWVLTYFCTWKGIKYTGKVMYVVTFPYLLFIVFFIRGVTLPGAGEGLKYLFIVDFYSIADPNVWWYSISMVVQFSSYLGISTSLGSYNKYNNNCYRDCLILCGLHVGTIFLLSLIAFSYVGFIAHIEGISINDAMSNGVDLVFVIFPKALSMLSGGPFWTVLFFLMIAVLALTHQFVLVESLATNVSDLLPRYLQKLLARELLVLAICGLFLFLGLLNISRVGILVTTMVDFANGDISHVFIVCFQTIVISWVYGADRFYDNIADMMGYVPFPVLKYCWLFILPLTSGLYIMFFQWRNHVIYGFGLWKSIIGFILIITPLMCIPVFMLISLRRGMQNMATPSSDLRQARPHKPALTLCKRVVCAGRAHPETSDQAEAIIM